jgi:hypothetical protein
MLGAVIGICVLALTVGIGFAARGGGSSPRPSAGDAELPSRPTSSTSATQTATTSSPSTLAPPSPKQTPSPGNGDATLTAENNPDLASILTADYCAASVRRFAAAYAGRTIAFDGSIANVAPHGRARFDVLLAPGDAGANSSVGPTFQYANVNVGDLNFTGDKVPTRLSAGEKLHLVAKVGIYNTGSCVFHLDPVATQTRL